MNSLKLLLFSSFSFFVLSISSYAATSIAVGTTPSSVTLVGTDLYITNLNSDTVSVIDTSLETVTDIIILRVSLNPNSAFLKGTKLYVLNQTSGDVSVLDTTTKTIVSTISVGGSPASGIIIGTKLYVNNFSSNNVSVIDTNTDTVSSTISVGTSPVVSTSVGTKLYVVNQDAPSLSIVDTTTDTVTSTIALGTSPSSISIVGTKLYITNQGSDTVSVVNTNTYTVSSTISVGDNPSLSRSVGTKLYVLNQTSNDVSIIDTNTDALINLYTLSYTAGSGGTLSGNTSQVVDAGTSGSAVTAVPNSGYVFSSWDDASTANPRTDVTVSTDINVTASFTLAPVALSRGGGGGLLAYIINERNAARGITTTQEDVFKKYIGPKSPKSEIKLLQGALNKVLAGQIKAPLAPDGIFKKKTTSALKQFQRSYGLVADGVFGVKTRAMMNKLFIK